MVYSLVVVTVLFSFVAAMFLGLAANAYLHVPAKVKVEVRRSEKKRRS